VRSGRFTRFLIAIGIGLGIGLAVGWLINPHTVTNYSPTTLRADYKADYVLMVAEIYHKDHDAVTALQRLAFLEDKTPIRQVQEAIVTAQKSNYSSADIDLMAQLLSVLQTGSTGATQ
jgi:hypothetical protein